MNLFDQVSNDIKSAMLAKDKVRLEALRGIKKEFLEAKTAKGADGELTDDMAMKILAKMVKQRKESAQIYTEQNRPDLAEPELAEAAVIETYLPSKCLIAKRRITSSGFSLITLSVSIVQFKYLFCIKPTVLLLSQK